MFKLQHVHSLSPELMMVIKRCQRQEPPAGSSLLTEISRKLDELKGQVKLMAEDLRSRMQAIDANTTRTAQAVTVVAERIRLLSEQVATGKLTEAEYQEVAAELARLSDFTGTVATNLELVAHGPEEPEPIDPEDVPPVEP